jgi:flagellar basal-body rod protein FlgB
MDIEGIASIALMRQNMRYLSARQSVLASNIAHVNTPNYRPKDVVKPNFKAVLSASNDGEFMATTNPLHMTIEGGAGGLSGLLTNSPMLETTPVGNSVVAEDELLKQSSTATQYSVTVGAYAKTLGLIRTATGTDR